ncbi:MAG: HAMP domain-containing histidine kinase [Clostridia bacterium]|nr:HAMP domain-containing histidine kinase [Clostridia bacterium]
MKRIRKYFSSIKFRMLLLYLAVVIVAFSVIMTVSLEVVEGAILKNHVDTRQSELNRVSYELTDHIEHVNVEAMHDTIVQYAQSTGGRLLVLNTSYVVVDDSASLYNGYCLRYDEAVEVLEGSSAGSYGFHKLKNSKDGGDEMIAYYAQPISSNGFNEGVLMLSVPIQQASNAIMKVQRSLWIVFGIILAVMTVIWVIATKNMLRPITQLTDVMRNATAKTFEKRVDIKGQGEIAELLDAFNRMGSELNAHDKIRDRFVADASHELKTPLAAIKALSESVIYCDDPPPELMLEFLKDINDQVDRLNNIVQDLLNVAKDASMNVEYTMEELNFSKILSEIIHLITPVAEKKGLKVKLQVDPDIKIFGDKLRIERVITNLVDNAIKYTEKGSIEVRLRRERRDAILSVKDTGIGIPEEAIPRLFIRFYRVDKARSRATGGTGLGLSMVDEIVNRHSGTIKVESKVGEGSEFTVRLPMSD